MCHEIIINGIKYIPANEIKTTNKVLVRTYSAGVFYGEIDTISENGKMITMKDSRNIWYWDGAASLSQLATDGTSKPENCKFPCTVYGITLTEVIQIIPCTEKACKSLNGVQVWKK